MLDESISLNGYSVVFPSVCVGNAAQLAVDLLISTLEMKKVATIWHVSLKATSNFSVGDTFIAFSTTDLHKKSPNIFFVPVSSHSSSRSACF